MPQSEISPLFASVRSALSGDRVVRAALLRARDITHCRIVMLQAGFGEVQLCVAMHADDAGERIRRAIIREADARLPEIEAHADVDRFPRDSPRDLLDPLTVRAYASVPLRVRDGIQGALHCLDERPREFTEEQLQDMDALGVTICGRLVPRDSAASMSGDALARRLRSLKCRLGPLDDVVRSCPQLTGTWHDLGEVIEQAATELESRTPRRGEHHAA